MERKDLMVNGVPVRQHERYPAYMAADVKKTGLPTYSREDRSAGGAAAHLQSMSQRRRSGRPVDAGEEVKGWYRVQYGYVPLYEQKE